MAGLGDFVKSKKTRPFIIAGGIFLVGLVLILLFRGASKGGGSTAVMQQGPSEQMQIASLQAQTQLQGMQIQAGLEYGAQQTQLAIEKMRGDLERESIGASLAGFTAQLQQQLAVADITSERELEATQAGILAQLSLGEMQRDIQLAGIGAQVSLAQAQKEVQLAGLSTQEEIAKANIQADVFRDQLAAEVSTAQAYYSSDVAKAVAGYAATTAQAQAQWSGQVAIAGFDAATEQARIQQQGLTTQTQLLSDMRATEARYAYKTEKNKGIFGAVGGLIGGLFSDVRLKENIRHVGETPQGIPLYAYNYTGGKAEHIGVMAHEAAIYNRAAVMEIDGFGAVDYERLAA